jgi:HEPN domain-containing protein
MRRGRIGAHIAKLPELLGEAKSAELPNPDMDERTNSLGLFNFAEAYRLSAIALQLENIAHGHAHTPVRTLYHHAIELYLKALLRQKYSDTVLAKRFRHDIKRMTKEAEKLGLTPMDEDREVFSVLTEMNAFIEARYIITGSKTFVTFEALNRTCCDNLREGVGRILRKNGVMIRL